MRPESLASALEGVLGPQAPSASSLASLDAAALRRVYRAAEPSSPDVVAGQVGAVQRIEAGVGAPAGTLTFRPVATTPGDSAVGDFAAAPGAARSILRAYRTGSSWDDCSALRLSFNLTPNAEDTRRSKFELRQVTPQLLVGAFLTAAELDRDGVPTQTLAQRQTFTVVSLSEPTAAYVAPAGAGYPWAATAPALGPCPSSWTPAFAVDRTAYPFASRCAALRFGTVHYFDESPAGPPRGTVLMVHGNPVWSFVYRNIASALLAKGFRVVAMDHYGFGLSDKPGLTDYPSLTRYGFTPHEQSETVEEFVEALDLRGVTLMVQDWGGPTGLSMGAHLPSRIRDLVIMNTWASNTPTETPWGAYNRVNSARIIETAETPRRTGQNLALLSGAEGSPSNLAVRNGYWGPFIDTATAATLTPTVAAPTNIFALNIFQDRDFLGELDRNVRRFLRTRKVAFLFGVESGGTGMPMGNDKGLTEFLSFWEPSKVVLDLRDPDAPHFIQETNLTDIVDAVETLHSP